jgi:hypothetical protein
VLWFQYFFVLELRGAKLRVSCNDVEPETKHTLPAKWR